MPSFQRLDILLYRGASFTSWLIKFLTKSQYSHVALVVNTDMYLGIESNTGRQSGVRAFDLRKLKMDTVDVFRIKPQYQVEHEVVISYLVGHLGKRYDFLGVLFLGLLKILSIVTLGLTAPIHNWWQRRKDYFCSELVWEAFATDAIDLVPQNGSSEITSPGDIAHSPLLEKIQ